jgi:hypothetical protein
MASEEMFNSLTVTAANSNSVTITIMFSPESPIIMSGGALLVQANGVVTQAAMGQAFLLGLPPAAEGITWFGFPTKITSLSGTITTDLAVDSDITVQVMSLSGEPVQAGMIPLGSTSGTVNWNATDQPAKSFTRGELRAFLADQRQRC